MGSITALGQLNVTALSVPGVYTQIVPPPNVLAGSPSNIVGIVGTAVWGPVNQAVIVGNAAGYTQSFGPLQNRTFDMGTAVTIACQQGSQNFRCVRVTDGTDVAASAVVAGTSSTGFELVARYTGTLGNGLTWFLSTGTAAGSYRLTLVLSGVGIVEVFDNVTGTGAALWTNLASAVNNGNSALRGPSQIAVASVAGSYNAAPAVSTTAASFSGGTDGVTTITSATLIGSDSTTPRKGMYALRSQGCSVAMLADATDPTQWTLQSQFGVGEGVYMILSTALGSAITNGTTGSVDLKASAGLDTYSCKLMHGDGLFWQDTTNNVVRIVSPQGFVAGLLGNLSPEQSTLNKPIFGIQGSQRSGLPGSGLNGTYANAELQALFTAGIDVIALPAAGGSYWACGRGCNASSNQAINGDNYTRLTNYIATTINALGVFVGQIINAQFFGNLKAALLGFLANMTQAGQLSQPSGATPYSVVCDTSINPPSRTSLGYVQANIVAIYGSIAVFLLLDLQGGQTAVVTVTDSTGQPIT
jgi:hypothetical protein